MSTIFWIVVKASALLGVVALVQLAVHRRTSAATRHFMWTVTAAGLLALPLVILLVPAWPIVVRTTMPAPMATAADAVDRAPLAPAAALETPSSGTSRSIAVRSAGGSQPSGTSWTGVLVQIPWTMALLIVYVAGMLWFSIRLIGQHLAIRRFARRAGTEEDSTWMNLVSECAGRMGIEGPVGLLRSRELIVPSVFGIRRPTIVIPMIADSWQDDRRRAAIVHEMAHVARLDCFTQALAGAACAAYWFHPGVWWLARRMRVERELACDDRVIAAGIAAPEYAGHLLEIAHSLGGGRVPALAAGMAHRKELEGRLLAALDAARNRRAPASGFCRASVAAAAMLVVPLAAATPTVRTVDVSDFGAVAPSVVTPDPARNASPAPQQQPAPPIEEGTPEAAGTWEIRPTDHAGIVHLRLVQPHSSSGEDVPLSALAGLSDTQLKGVGGPVYFRVKRDAGTFTFEGVVRRGVGAGTFSFTPDPAFSAELAKRGLDRPTARQQFEMARDDVGFALLDELHRQGYEKPATSELVRAGEHGVNMAYLRGMGSAGYRAGSLPALITLRDHGVTADYIRALQAAGYTNLPIDTVRRVRDHGITPEYIKAMSDAGYTKLPLMDLVDARDHGVSAEFIRQLADDGYTKLPLDEVIRTRDHGVSPEFVSNMRQLGYTMSLEDLVRARDHGVDDRFVQDLAALGYRHLTPDDLVMLRDYGLTPDRIRAANARAGTRLPLEMLKKLAMGGGAF